MSNVRDSDTSLWLHNKLGTSNNTWIGGSICSQLNLVVLRNIRDCFVDLDSHVKLKLLLTFLHVSRKRIEEWQTEVEEVLAIATQDSDQWVSMLAEVMQTYPATGILNTDIGKVEENKNIFVDLIDELKELVKKNLDLNLLPLECHYLNKTAFGQIVQPERHFSLRRRPRAVTLRADLLRRAAEGAAQLARHQAAGAGPLRCSRSTPRPPAHSAGPPRALLCRPVSGGGSGGSGGRRRPPPVPGSTPHQARTVKMLDITEQPASLQRGKRRRKAPDVGGREQAAAAAEEEEPSQQAVAADTPDYAAGLPVPAPAPAAAPEPPCHPSAVSERRPAVDPASAGTPQPGPPVGPDPVSGPPVGPGPVYGLSVAPSPGWGSSADPVPIWGPSVGPGTAYGPPVGPGYVWGSSVGLAPAYGPSAGPGPAYGPSVGTGPAYGPSVGPGPAYGPSAGPGPAYGLPAGPGPAYGPSSGPGPAYGPSVGPGPAYGLSAGPGPAYGPSAGPGSAYVPSAGPGPVYGPSAGPGTVSGPLPSAPDMYVPRSRPPPVRRASGLGAQPQQLLLRPVGGAEMQPVTSSVQPQPPPQPAGDRAPLTLTREQMLKAQEMFSSANKVTRPERALILGFIAGSRDNPCPHLGDVVTIKLSECVERQAAADAGPGSAAVLAESHFQMNYATGQWKRITKFRRLDHTLG